MSRHFYYTTTDQSGFTKVTMGWDRPLKQFFLRIESVAVTNRPMDTPANEDKTLFDSLGGVPGADDDITTFIEILRQYGIKLPKRMELELCEESLYIPAGGNKLILHALDGENYIRTDLMAA